MASAPTTPKYINNFQPSTLQQLTESPTVSVTSMSDINIDIDNTNTTNSTNTQLYHKAYSMSDSNNTHHHHSKSSLPSTKKHKKRKHKKTTSLSLTQKDIGSNNEDEDEKLPIKLTLKQSSSKSLKRKQKIGTNIKAKSIAFSVDDNDNDKINVDKIAELPRNHTHSSKKKKIRFKKRRSVTPGHDIKKIEQKNLVVVNQFLLPVPKKQHYYKWAICDPLDLSPKVKQTGNINNLLNSLVENIIDGTANLCLVQTNDLLICLSNITQSTSVILRTHCTQSNQTIKEFFGIPIPIRSYGNNLDISSLKHLFSSAREQKYLKAHKSRCKPRGITRNMKLNTKWDLDTTHKETIRRLKKLLNDKDPIDWAIFDFIPNTNKKNTKYLVINDGQYGRGGSEKLSKNLAKINEMRYALLAIIYGHIVKHRLVLLIIWNPIQNKQSIHNPVSVKTNRYRHHSHTSTIVFWQHKQQIKTFAQAKKEMNINLHSKLAESMIISSLHRDGLIDDIIIRVTKISNNTSNDLSYVQPTPVPRQWTLLQLKHKLCDEYKMNINKIRISLVPNNIKKCKRKKSMSKARSESHHYQILDGNEKTLDQLHINHGDQIYIDDFDNNNNNNNNMFSVSKIKDDRERALAYLFYPNRKSLSYHHRREMSMPMLIFKQKESKNNKKKSKYKRKKKHKKKKESQHHATYSELLIPRSFSEKNHAISVGWLPKIKESLTASTPPHLLPNEKTIKLSKSASFKRKKSNESIAESITESVTDNTSDNTSDDSDIQLQLQETKSVEINHIKQHIKQDIKLNKIDQIKQKLNMDQKVKKRKKRKKYRKDNDKINDTNTESPISPSSLSLSTSDNCIMSPLTSPAPAPAPAPVHSPAPIPISQSSDGDIPVAPTFAPTVVFGTGIKRKPKKLKTHLHELNDKVEQEEIEEEDESDLKPSDIFTETNGYGENDLKQLDNINMNIINGIKDNNNNNNNNNNNSNDSDEDDLVPLPDTILMSNDSLVKTDSNIELNDLFITTYNIGRGKTATVHQALYKNTVFVAVKEFVFQNLSQSILEDFHKEANTLKNLRHPNIAMLVGSYLDEVSGELYIVLEWLPGGCLHDLLHQKDPDEVIEINYYDVLLMAIDIARGMKYLHRKNIIHRDLKTHNLLLDEEYRVKVTDFGTAKHLNQIKSKAFTEVGTLGYVAPEVLDPPINGYDGKVDVFSYGVILWEIYTSSVCKGNEDNVLTSVSTLQYAQRLKSGFRPSIPDTCPREFTDLIQGCWEYRPEKRPTFEQIVVYLEKIIKIHQNEFCGNLYNIGNYSDDDDDDDEYEDDEEEEDEYDNDDESDEYQHDSENININTN